LSPTFTAVPIRADIQGGADLLWIGFDMGHAEDFNLDLMLALTRSGMDMAPANRRDFDDVRAETQRLAEQARSAA